MQGVREFKHIKTLTHSLRTLSHQVCYRGVKLGWLVKWTTQNDCWHMSTYDVIENIIKPACAETHCRYVELPEVNTLGAA